MTAPGLRERKKARTRQVIADAAARLFAERGYERVAVSDVARAAEVSEQTVYNYFQTKEQLVIDRDEQIQDELSRLIRARAPGTTPAAAVRDFVLGTVEGIRRIPAGQWRGELGFLPRSARPSAGSPWRCQTGRPAPSPPPSARRRR
jgi:AcrR family transcriptional regulator